MTMSNFFFFFQAEDGIRDFHVTGVQTCALPISHADGNRIPMNVQKVCVLGSTGSIGENTLDVIARHPERFSVHSLSAYSRIGRLVEQAAATHAKVVVVPDDDARKRFVGLWQGPSLPEVRVGAQALADTAADPEVTTVMAAIVGTAGLPAALAAARAGKRVLLANKEALVAAGGLFMQAVRDH